MGAVFDDLIALVVVLSVAGVFFLKIMNKSVGEIITEIKEAMNPDE